MKELVVCILNYNGFRDTIECIESVRKYENMSKITVVILDNGSENESVLELERYLNNSKDELLNTKIIDLKELEELPLKNYEIILVKSSENYGFAGGNNLIIKQAVLSNYKFITLLNNDTEFIMPSIEPLSNFMNDFPDYGVVTSNIVYHANPDRVWNAGGRLFLGTRKYYTNKEVNNNLSSGNNKIIVNFVTGCFMMVRREVFIKYGILSDKFFFGEEDYEFCMRLKSNNVKMCALLDVKICHKVGATIKEKNIGKNDINKSLVHHLNRYVDMKDYYRPLFWRTWKFISNMYILLLMSLKKEMKIGETIQYVSILNKLSKKHHNVDKELFEKIMNNRNLKSLFP
ncbi:Glycosyl transferase family 2 [Paenibacillus konkukensis]|uniref:Glycosyl transferase family 2 n=1 Tax=Paenibacillus konkukensis TaxID=2020716 RepID=A0ABY4RPD5_9BACL|nr:glycosyltransferase family 2 protein [Paenibacillus konkukensis]UQZ84336.1 Glycosyl transferase family 2 [Paenibacillus konkukensis]